MNLLIIPAIILLVMLSFLFFPFRLSFHLEIAGYSICGFFKVLVFGWSVYRGDFISPKDATGKGKVEGLKKTKDVEHADKEKKVESEGEDEYREIINSRKGFSKEPEKSKDLKDISNKWSTYNLEPFPKEIHLLIDAMPALSSILRDLIRSIHIDQLSCNVTLGFNDPADNAIFYGYIWALESAVPFPVVVKLEPYFHGEYLEGSIEAEIWIRFSEIIMAAINAIRMKTIRRLGLELIQEKISRKKTSMMWL